MIYQHPGTVPNPQNKPPQNNVMSTSQQQRNYQNIPNPQQQYYIKQQQPPQNVVYSQFQPQPPYQIKKSQAEYSSSSQQNRGVHPSLMQPPSLAPEQNLSSNSQLIQQKNVNPMNHSHHNPYSQFDPYPNHQNQHFDNEAAVFWEQKCMTMLSRFEWFYERFEMLRNQYLALSQEMEVMDSEDQWNNFQEHHVEYREKIEQMQQQLSVFLAENQQILHQRRQQEDDKQHEKRYLELLGNFKTLQEEQDIYKQQANENYQNLEEHYQQLEYQYSNAIKELNQFRQGKVVQPVDNNQQLHQRLIQYNQIIENSKISINSLHNQNVQLQNMVREYQVQIQKKKEQEFRSSIDKNQYNELVKLLELRQNELSKLRQDGSLKVDRSNNQFEEIKKALNDKNRELTETKSKVTLLETKYKEEEEFEKKRKDKKIVQLTKQIEELRQQVIKSTQSSHKVESLEKKLNYSNQQVQNLNQNLKKKNQQLIELRGLTYEVEKLKEVKEQYYKIQNQKQKNNQTLKKKNQQIENLHGQIEELTSRLQESTNKRNQYHYRHMMSEIEELNQHIRKKDAEINKCKGIISVKEEFIGNLEDDLLKTKDKNLSLEQIIQTDKESKRQNLQKSDRKNYEYQRKMKDVSNEFNQQLKQTLQTQIGELRKQNYEKQEKIRQIQESEIMLKAKLVIFEKQKQNIDRDMNLLKQKQNQIERHNDQIQNKNNMLEQIIQEKEEEIKSIRISEMNLRNAYIATEGKNDQFTGNIKGKAQIIYQMQIQLNDLIAKNKENQKIILQNLTLKKNLNIVSEELEKFKEEADFDSKSKKSKVTFANASQQEASDRGMIKLLTEENQLLKDELLKIIEQLGEEEKKEESQKLYKSAYKTSQNLNPASKVRQVQNLPASKVSPRNLQERLNQFNSKLNMVLQGQNSVGLYQEKSQQNFNWQKIKQSNWEQQKQQLINKHEEELRAINQQLRQYKNANSQFFESPASTVTKVYTNFDGQKLKQEISFYKQKQKELNQRVKTLLKLNQQLKLKLTSFLKIKDNNINDYYKQEMQRTETQNEGLRNRLKKVTQENKERKFELNCKNNKLMLEYETKIFELELGIDELKRKINYMQIEKSLNENEKVNMMQEIMFHTEGETKKEIISLKDDYAMKTPSEELSHKYFGSNNMKQEFLNVIGNVSKNSSPKTNQYYSNRPTPKQRPGEDRFFKKK